MGGVIFDEKSVAEDKKAFDRFKYEGLYAPC